MSAHEIVSFDEELLIVVDEDDNVLDYKSKAECHQGGGILHRAFSIFIFNSRHELVLQQRSAQKLLWPLFWSNSCCSHPRKGETLEQAAHRRLEQELGISTPLKYLYTFQYQATYKTIGSENERCAVLIGHSDAPVSVNKNEIAEWKYISLDKLNTELAGQGETYTPWFKMEWKKLSSEFMSEINAL
ncbi:MAG: isopentenyl-diphosphate delta-isomerase [Calditrichales bacterium]|nr:MAG: isopentenyl-diphosphate delta-isomerase [Calditrichales bacterium]